MPEPAQPDSSDIERWRLILSEFGIAFEETQGAHLPQLTVRGREGTAVFIAFTKDEKFFEFTSGHC